MDPPGQVSVFVKIKPPGGPDFDSAISILSPTTISVEDESIYPTGGVSTKFSCDGVIGPDESVGDKLGAAVRAALRTEDVLVMGYGHSGSGKTFSIFGQDGILDSVSNQLTSEGSAQVSFLQVYNEKVYDLLSLGSALPLHDDIHRHVFVKGLTAVSVESTDELYAVVDVGMRNRFVAENAVHRHSSRSHAVLRITTNRSSLWLADLAGSERINPTSRLAKQSKLQTFEITNIHKSLHALRRCIMGLRSSPGFLPVRSSVLTRLLFSSEIRSCVVIACVAPDKHCVSETLSTLDFASAGLNASGWTNQRQRSLSETELLRYALAKLRRELEIEKARRVRLENEISRSASPALGFAHGGSAGTIKRLNYSIKEDDSASPPALVRAGGDAGQIFHKERPSWADESIKLTPAPRHSFFDQPSMIAPNCDDSVLSQTWRHNQYDAILQRCWQERVTG